jgi:hypothetical protein
MNDLDLVGLPSSASSSRQEESDSSHLNTPQFFGISPTLSTPFYLGTNGGWFFCVKTVMEVHSFLRKNRFDLIELVSHRAAIKPADSPS